MSAVLPEPTRDVAQGLRNIAEDGLTIVPDVLVGDDLKRVRDALYRAAGSDRARGREERFSHDCAEDDTNQRVWHTTGHNCTPGETRAGIFAWYTKPIYRPQENWFLSLKPEVRQFASDDALVLLGYKSEGLGLVHGLSPA